MRCPSSHAVSELHAHGQAVPPFVFLVVPVQGIWQTLAPSGHRPHDHNTRDPKCVQPVYCLLDLRPLRSIHESREDDLIGPVPHYPCEARHGGVFLLLSPQGRQHMPANALHVVRLVLGGVEDGTPANSIQGFGALNVVVTPFLAFGLARKPRSLADVLMAAWLFLALMLAVCTDANINRINLVWLPALWFVGRGLAALRAFAVPFRASVALLVAWSAAFIVAYFFGTWQRDSGPHFCAGFGTALQATLADATPEETIALTDRMNMPYISALFFSRTPVREFVKTAVIANPGSQFQVVSSFGRFRMGVDPNTIAKYHHLVVQETELNLFTAAEWEVQRYGGFATVRRR